MASLHTIPADVGLPEGSEWYLTGGGGMLAALGVAPSTDLAWYGDEVSAAEWDVLRSDLTEVGSDGERRPRLRMPVHDPLWRDGASLLLVVNQRLYSLPGAWSDLVLFDRVDLAVQSESPEAPAVLIVRRRVRRPGTLEVGWPPWRWQTIGFVSLRGFPLATRSEA
tara:strand:+ start:970 stop:1467 length:498 start_codon:yes stop_codon:yes gene_type:complete